MTHSLTTGFIRRKDLGSDRFSLAEKVMDLYISFELFKALILIFCICITLMTLYTCAVHNHGPCLMPAVSAGGQTPADHCYVLTAAQREGLQLM